MIRRISHVLSMLAVFTGLFAQPSDTARIFTQEEFLQQVLAYHPVVRQAALLDRQAEAALQAARGNFDPKLYSDWEQKSFDSKEYFTTGESGLKIPTWYGIELKGAFLTADGIFLNPQNNLPSEGQAVAGIKASLLQGMIIDERRAALQQARLLADVNEAERQTIVNNLLVAALYAYWEWSVAYRQTLIYDRALIIARERLDGVVQSFIQGDVPAIDTLETFIQVQNREFDLNEARINYRNAGLALSNFLWLEGDIPLEITNRLRPQPPDRPADRYAVAPLQEYLQVLTQQHPELRTYQLKISQLEIDRQLAAEQLKPRLDVEYNFLGRGTDFINNQSDNFSALRELFTQNYKWRVQFSMPILLRKERGKLELNRLKILDADYNLRQKQLELNNKLENYYNDLQNTRRQIDLYAETTNNYQRLLEAEQQKMAIGESSVFLLNSREQKLIEAQLKLAKLQGYYQKLIASLEWAAGRLGRD